MVKNIRSVNRGSNRGQGGSFSDMGMLSTSGSLVTRMCSSNDVVWKECMVHVKEMRNACKIFVE
jgi:hypothetical protein